MTTGMAATIDEAVIPKSGCSALNRGSARIARVEWAAHSFRGEDADKSLFAIIGWNGV